MAGIGRRSLLKTASVAAGGLALGAPLTAAQVSAQATPVPPQAPRNGGGALNVRFIGGGVVEVATPDYKQIAYVDAWIWNNAAYLVQKVQRPAELASPGAFADYLSARSPDAVLVLLTHDHGDHSGDYFEMLQTLVGAGLPVKTTGQSDLMGSGLRQKFSDAGLDPGALLLNGGLGQNFGGHAAHGGMQTWLVPAVHSNNSGFPAAGFILDIGGLRVYASGDTDLYGDMRLIGDRYHPDLALVCVGDGPYTMGPRDAALASQWTGVSQAVPIHFAHTPLALGVEAAMQFKNALAELAPSTTAQLLQIGESRLLTF